jgi:hypothetical protein
VCRPKHVELYVKKGIIKSFDTLLHLVGYFYMNYNMMHGSTDIVSNYFYYYLLQNYAVIIMCGYKILFENVHLLYMNRLFSPNLLEIFVMFECLYVCISTFFLYLIGCQILQCVGDYFCAL